jgi:hypothetical protein
MPNIFKINLLKSYEILIEQSAIKCPQVLYMHVNPRLDNYTINKSEVVHIIIQKSRLYIQYIF